MNNSNNSNNINNTNRWSNTFTNTTNEQLLLINILNTMYDDNSRQIQQLTEYNNQIRNVLTNILLNPQQNNNRRQNNRFNNLLRRNNTNSSYIFDYNTQDINTTNFNNLFENIATQPINRSLYNSDLSNNTAFRIFQSFFEPIEIYPTQTQIENATRNVRFCDIITPVNMSCPITLETFTDNDMVTVIRHCGHIFNREQLNIWFRSNCKCPVCRYDIRDYNSNQTINSFFNDSNTNNNILNTSNSNSHQQNSFENNIQREIINSIQPLFNLIQDPSGNFNPNDAYVYSLFNDVFNNLR